MNTGDYESISSQPDWYQQLMQDVASRGYAASYQPYQQYTGQVLAGATPQQQQAYNLVSQNVGQFGVGPAQQQAIQSSNYNPNNLQQFLSPYAQGVAENIARLGTQNYTENILPQTNSAFTGAGQFGSTRNQDAVNRAARDVQANITGAQQGALNQAYQQAQQGALGWGQLGLQGANTLGNLAQTGQNIGLQDVNALNTVGQQQQNQQQQGLNWAYNQFQQQQQYPQQQIGWLSNLARGIQPGTASQSGANYAGPQQTQSPFAVALGGLGGALSSGIFKKGGRVKRRGPYGRR